MTTTPDVSVIIAVYNTMPYLTACLDSVAAQNIGMDRLEVILIDDGSNDGSEHVVDDFAADNAGSVKVRHQSNSGTPAAPFNRGLELATGRYVFFLGADDYLGVEALQRLVRAADEWESDVVFGKVVGVGARSVNKRVFSHGTVADLDLFNSELRYGLSNAKMFRRELIERLGLRYREDIRSRCDQPFTLTAIVRARRVSVLTDYDYYFGIKRADESNVTYTADSAQVLRSARIIMETIAELVEPGPRRDFVMMRQFHWELVALLNPDFLDLSDADQRSVCEGVGTLADKYLTPAMLPQVNGRERLRLVLAQRRDLEGLRAVIESIKAFKAGGSAPLLAENGRLFQRFPGFREGGLPDETFEILGERVTGRLARGFETRAIRVDGTSLVIDAVIDVVGLEASMIQAELLPIAKRSAARPPGVAKRPLDAQIPLQIDITDNGSGVTVTVDGKALAASESTLWSLRMRVNLRGTVYDLPFAAVSDNGAVSDNRGVRVCRGVRIFAVAVETGPEGRLVIMKTRRKPGRAAVARLRAMRRG